MGLRFFINQSLKCERRAIAKSRIIPKQMGRRSQVSLRPRKERPRKIVSPTFFDIF